VTLDSTWKITARGSGATLYTTRWKGTGLVIPAFGHFLITGTSYTQSPAGDQTLSTGITDASSIVLVQGTTDVDVVCYAYDSATQAILTNAASGYTCAGTPADNSPHNDGNTAASNVDQSIVRKPGGSAGNCTDTNDSAADFAKSAPASPMDAASPPTP
jgi:hypothetical protein